MSYCVNTLELIENLKNRFYFKELVNKKMYWKDYIPYHPLEKFCCYSINWNLDRVSLSLSIFKPLPIDWGLVNPKFKIFLLLYKYKTFDTFLKAWTLCTSIICKKIENLHKSKSQNATKKIFPVNCKIFRTLICIQQNFKICNFFLLALVQKSVRNNPIQCCIGLCSMPEE